LSHRRIVVGDAGQAVVDGEAVLRAGVVEVIDAVELGEHVVAERGVVAQEHGDGQICSRGTTTVTRCGTR
jgi:hypothetical protein